MPAILLAILKMLGTAAMTGAKAVGKGATAVGKWGLNRMQQGAGLGKLTEAFASDKGGNTPQMLAGTAFDPKKYGIEQTPNVDLGRIRVPGPMGQSIQGQGEAMPRYGMTSNRIPPAYLQMGQQQPQQGGQQHPDVGAIRGFINALTGQPQPEGLQDVSQGRRTAYYAGGVVPNIVMSKLGQPSSSEATSREMLNQYYQTGSPMYDPATGKLTGQNIPARAVAQKKESPSEQKYSKELDFNASLKDWAGGAVDDEMAYKMMSENFPEMQKQIDEYYFRKTGIYPVGKGRR